MLRKIKFEEREVIPDNYICGFTYVRTEEGWALASKINALTSFYSLNLDGEMSWRQPVYFGKKKEKHIVAEYENLDNVFYFPKNTIVQINERSFERFDLVSLNKKKEYLCDEHTYYFYFKEPCFVPVSFDKYNYILLPV